jgi:hypothetical protein
MCLQHLSWTITREYKAPRAKEVAEECCISLYVISIPTTDDGWYREKKERNLFFFLIFFFLSALSSTVGLSTGTMMPDRCSLLLTIIIPHSLREKVNNE